MRPPQYPTLAALQSLPGARLPTTDPAALELLIRQREFARAEHLSPREVEEMPPDFVPPEPQ